MLVVAVTVVGSLTFLPATLSFLGEKNWLEKGRVPYVTRRRHQTKGESRVWGAILDRVLRRPLVSALLAGGLLVALSIPALGLQFKDPGFEGYSRSQPVIQTYDRVQAAFPAAPFRRRPSSRPRTSRPRRSRPRSGSCTTRRSPPGQLSEPSGRRHQPDKDVAVVALSVKGSGTDAASERSLEVLRSQVVPATVGRLPTPKSR
jgi:RND superfamily putative drug exporter